MKKWAMRALISLSLLPAVVCAADSNGNFSVLTITKDSSCGQYVDARDEGRRGDHIEQNKFAGWLEGYLTAYNELMPDTYDVTGSTDTESMLLWLENYCRSHPLDTFSTAVVSLIVELYPKRAKKAPAGE